MLLNFLVTVKTQTAGHGKTFIVYTMIFQLSSANLEQGYWGLVSLNSAPVSLNITRVNLNITQVSVKFGLHKAPVGLLMVSSVMEMLS